MYDRFNHPVIALHRTKAADVHRFGVLTGTWMVDDEGDVAGTSSPVAPSTGTKDALASESSHADPFGGKLLQVGEIMEKPSIERARAMLRTEGLEEVWRLPQTLFCSVARTRCLS